MTRIPTVVAVSVEDLEMAYGDQKILDKATLTIHEDERVALVGRNGCGKSTFMKILAGVEEPDAGHINRKKALRTGYLPQEFRLEETLTVYDNILQGVSHIAAMLKEYESISHDSYRSQQLETAIHHLDGWNLDNKIEKVVTALKCAPKEHKIQNLSGGEKRRVALAKALISDPDLLILDEPTNHLDTASIEWLEDTIKSRRGTCLFVTHDRYFIDRICTRIVELRDGEFQSFRGGYVNYINAKVEQIEQAQVTEKKRQKVLQKELEWVKRSPKARTTKAQFRVNRYLDLAAQKSPEKEMDVDLIIPPAARMGNRVISVKNVTMAYKNKVLFEDFTHKFVPGAKVGVIGPNGVGKTTLVKTIIGLLKPTKGRVEISPNTQFNYIDQERLNLNDQNTVIDEIGEGHEFVVLGEEKVSVWGYLKRFLFTDERIRTKVERLSGGERARLLLAKILKHGGNFIVLDEPTNDLDLSTLRLLEDALIRFKGCVLLVSHDRYFLNRVCTGILAFEKDLQLTHHVGNYDYYMSKRAERLVDNTDKKESRAAPHIFHNKPKIHKLKWKEERELKGMEDNILFVEQEIEELNALFMDPNFYKESHEKVKEAEDKLKIAQLKRDRLYARWEELETIKNGDVPLG